MGFSVVSPMSRYNRVLPHPLPRPAGLIEVDTVLDIGAEIHPMDWYKPKRHICIEPHGPYAERLRAAGYETRQTMALDAFRTFFPGEVDAIYMFDVIEHMTRAEGAEVLQLALALKPKQIAISTPNGYHKQDTEEYGLGGEYWQTHRSGWVPEDFPGWAISFYNTEVRVGFFATWTR